MNEDSLTATVASPAEQDRPSAKAGVRYEVGATGFWRRVEGELAVAIGDVDPGEIQRGYAEEMVSRANALPDTEAKLTEAVELLERIAGQECPHIPLPGCPRCEARAFLGKVKA